MDSYPYTISSSSTQQFTSYQQTQRKSKPLPSYYDTLHSVRKLPQPKPILHSVRKLPQPKPMTKKPIAPLPPTKPRIYQVDSANFKQVVQRLTSVPQFHSRNRNLRDLAPPPLNLTPISTETVAHQPLSYANTSPSSGSFYNMMDGAQDVNIVKQTVNFGTPSPLGFSMSPASLAWCSYLLESPGTLSTLEQGPVNVS